MRMATFKPQKVVVGLHDFVQIFDGYLPMNDSVKGE